MVALAVLLASASRSDAVGVAEGLAAKLSALKSVSFQYTREISYASDGFRHTLPASMYVEFDSKCRPTGARFRGSSSHFVSAFDGARYWLRPDSGPLVEETPPKSLSSVSILKNSVVNLAAFLRFVIRDHPSAISLDGKTLLIAVPKVEFDAAKVHVAVGYDPVYRISIDPAHGLPTQIVQSLANKGDTITTKFTAWNLAPSTPSSADWLPG